MSLLNEGNPIVWFEIPTRELERAKTFYDTIFDIDVQLFDAGDLRYGFFPMEEGGVNATGALVHYPSMYEPSHDGALVYFSVRDIEAVLSRVAPAGGKVIQQRKAVGEFGFVGFFEDSEGNRIGLHTRS